MSLSKGVTTTSKLQIFQVDVVKINSNIATAMSIFRIFKTAGQYLHVIKTYSITFCQRYRSVRNTLILGFHFTEIKLSKLVWMVKNLYFTTRDNILMEDLNNTCYSIILTSSVLLLKTNCYILQTRTLYIFVLLILHLAEYGSFGPT